MSKHFENDYNFQSSVDREALPYNYAGKTPKTVKGGVFAPSDYDLIKKVLTYYVSHMSEYVVIPDAEHKQIANLMHRLNSRV